MNQPAGAAPSPPSVAARLLLGRDARQRIRVRHSLMSSQMYLLCSALMLYTAWLGQVPWANALGMSAWMLGSGALFYLLLRSGMSRRWRDPSLTLPQILAAIACVAGCYANAPVHHGGALAMLVMVLAFGVFNLSRRQARWATAWALLALGAAAAWRQAGDPLHYPGALQLLNLAVVALLAPVLTREAAALAALRVELRAQNDQLNEALRRIEAMAERDELTGLSNRRAAADMLAREAARPAGGRRLCVAMLDLDHFKHINDTHGHAAGDEVLRAFAALALATLRECDLLARWGGEEFLLAMPGTELPQARLAIERLRQALQQQPWLPGVLEGPVTFSAGIAEVLHAADLEAAIARADGALYAAKQAGRDRSECA